MAMLCGRPAFAPQIGGIPEIVDDGVTGLLVVPGNVEDNTEKIHFILGNPNLYLQIEQTGRNKVLREYSPDKYF